MSSFARQTAPYTQKEEADLLQQTSRPEHGGLGGNQALLSLLTPDAVQMPQTSAGTPLSDTMRTRFEEKFGLPLEDVRLHRNSELPAQLGASAYTYGSDVFLGPGQERYISHEMTHVAQQKLGIVQPTDEVCHLPLNRSPELEHSADLGIVPQTAELQSAEPVVQCGGGPLEEDLKNFQSWKEELEKIGSAAKKPAPNHKGQYDVTQMSMEELAGLSEHFTAEQYVYVSENEGRIGSIYFGGGEAKEAYKDGDKAQKEAVRSAPQGGRIRLLHNNGPEICFYDHNMRYSGTSSHPNMRERMFNDSPQSERHHRSRGKMTQKDLKLEPGDFRDLFLAAAYAQSALSGEDHKRANEFLRAFMQTNENLKGIPLDERCLGETDQHMETAPMEAVPVERGPVPVHPPLPKKYGMDEDVGCCLFCRC